MCKCLKSKRSHKACNSPTPNSSYEKPFYMPYSNTHSIDLVVAY